MRIRASNDANMAYWELGGRTAL